MDLFTDSDLITEVKEGNKDAFNEIVKRYETLLSSVVDKFLSDENFVKSDRDDLYQEAAIALYNAVMSFDLKQNEVTFGLYAKICLSNSLNSALRKRIRQLKADKLQKETSNVDTEVEFDENSVDAGILFCRVESMLSELEKKVFRLVIRKYSHKEIAERLCCGEKTVDNAVYRIKCKISKLL